MQAAQQHSMAAAGLAPQPQQPQQGMAGGLSGPQLQAALQAQAQAQHYHAAGQQQLLQQQQQAQHPQWAAAAMQLQGERAAQCSGAPTPAPWRPAAISYVR